MTNIFERLKQDHQKQRTLIELVGKTSGDSTGRREMFERLVVELRAHATAEERTLYAEMLGHADTQGETAHSIHEHEKMDSMIDELLETDLSSSGWIMKFRTLAESVEHHLAEEERDTFKAGVELLSTDAQAALGTSFSNVKSQQLEALTVNVG